MRMRVKQTLSIILAFVLISGCFAGTGITARAGIFEIGISSEELESKAGKVTVTVAGGELGDTIWWVLEKENPAQEEDEETVEVREEIYEAVGEKINTADVDDIHMKSEFSVDIPENTGSEDAVYRIRVAATDPYDPETGEYKWGEEEVKVTVAARANEQPEEMNGTVLDDESRDVQAEKETEIMDEAQVNVEETLDDAQIAEMPEAATEELSPQSSKVPTYHTIPAYQQKDLYGVPTVKIKGLPVKVNVDGTAGGKTELYTEPIKFKLYNGTTQKEIGTVEARNGYLPDLYLTDNHTYIISSRDSDYKVVRYDGNEKKVLSKNAYIWVKNGKIYNIKEGAEAPYNYPVFSEIEIARRGSGESKTDDRVPLYLKVRYKDKNGGQLYNVKLKFVSEVETIETNTGNGGRIPGVDVQLLEDVNYIIVVDDPRYGIDAYPITAKDKSEYRSIKGLPGERYFYDHSDCHQVEEIYLVNIKDAHKNDKTITSLSGNTTVSGFNFKDFLLVEKKLSKSLVTGLSGKDYDVFDISAVNPHRWEISKLATGNFRITEKIDITKKVDNLYYIDKSGKLRPIAFSQKNNTVSFTMNSLSVHPVVFVYNPAKKVIVQKISVSGISKTIAAGKKVKLTAGIAPSNAENKAVTWTSSNKKYATVDSKGKVTTKKAGAGKTVKITATAKDGSGIKGVYQIKITKHAVKKISLRAKKTVKAGKKITVKATVKTTGKKANKKLKWTTSNKKYATVNSKGKVSTKKAGKGKKVKITAMATDGSGKKKAVTIKIK